MTCTGRGQDDAGFGLPDLLVAMLLASIVLTAVTAVFTSAIRTSRDTTASVAGTAEVRNALDLMARRLRVAILPTSGTNSFVTSAPNDVVFYASIVVRGTTTDPAPTRVEYVFDAASTCLREKLTPAVGAATSTCIAFGAVNSGGSLPMFSYYDTGTSTSTLPNDATGNVASPGAIDSVGVTLQVASRSDSQQAVPRASTRVTLSNLNVSGGL